MRELKPWEERFVKEYRELAEKRKRLGDMLEKWNLGTLEFTPKCPYDLLWKQYLSMGEYENVLLERADIEGIPLFEKEEEKQASPTLVTSQHFCYECKNFDGEKGKCRLPGTPDDPYYCGLANFWEKNTSPCQSCAHQACSKGHPVIADGQCEDFEK